MLDCEKELLTLQLREHGECVVRVGGYCMKPVIQSGALVTIRNAAPESVQPQEIIAYFVGTNLYVHRFIRKEDDTLIVQADNKKPDIHAISATDFLGKVVAIRNPSLLKRLHTKIYGYFREN